MARVIDAREKFAARARTVRLRELWSLVGELGLRIPGGKEAAEEIMRELCWERYGVESTKDLSGDQLRAVSRVLRGKLYDVPEPPTPATLDTPITRKQQRAIAWLYAEAGLDTPARRRGFAKKIIKKAKPSTREEGTKLYQALEALCLHEVDWEAVKAQVQICQTFSRGLNVWQQQMVKEAAQKLDKGQRLTYWLVYTIAKIYRDIHGGKKNARFSGSSREPGTG